MSAEKSVQITAVFSASSYLTRLYLAMKRKIASILSAERCRSEANSATECG